MAADELQLEPEVPSFENRYFLKAFAPIAAAQKPCVKVISPTTTLEHGEYREQ
jgi:hypothetical protein